MITKYTDEQVTKLKDAYTASPSQETIEVLAQEMGKSTRSVVAKLAQLRIYEAKEARKVSYTKASIITRIARQLGMDDPKPLQSLEKADKPALEALFRALS